MDINSGTLEELQREFGSKIEPDIFAGNGAIDRLGEAEHGVDNVVSRVSGVAGVVPPLHNRFEPVIVLKHEKPEHRLVAVLKSTGLTNREIADMTGYTPLQVSTICKQEAVEKFILERMHGTGDAAMQRLHEASVKAAERLIHLAEHAKNEECKRKANNDILDRRYGKPNQPYSVQTKQAGELEDSELAKIAQGN